MQTGSFLVYPSLNVVKTLISLSLCLSLQVSTDGTNRSLQYRYVVTPSTMVNAFKGEDLVKEQPDVNKFRAPQLGALFNGRLSQLPRGKNASIVWEAWWSQTQTTQTTEIIV